MTGRRLPNYHWIKFELAYLDDPDFMQLADATAGVYVKLYLLAGRADAGGLLSNKQKPFSEKDLSFQLRLDRAVLQPALSELIEAGLLKRDGEGFRITRFLDEQGPGDNLQREKWAGRQRKHRAQALGEIQEQEVEEETEEELRLRIRGEVEGEGHGDITVTNQNVTVTPPNHPNELFSDFRLKVISSLEAQGITPDLSRLDACIVYWKDLAGRQGYFSNNLEAILELYSPGALEERRQREAVKQAKRNGRNPETAQPEMAPGEYEATSSKIQAAKAQRAAVELVTRHD